MPQPRISLLGTAGYRIAGHNEEHLVIEPPDAGRYRPGDVVYGVPTHICPTVARYESASVIEHGRCTGEWRITARRPTHQHLSTTWHDHSSSTRTWTSR